ncbi:TP53 regulating kinase, partial [Cichlidogyrus casuarinus]
KNHKLLLDNDEEPPKFEIETSSDFVSNFLDNVEIDEPNEQNEADINTLLTSINPNAQQRILLAKVNVLTEENHNAANIISNLKAEIAQTKARLNEVEEERAKLFQSHSALTNATNKLKKEHDALKSKHSVSECERIRFRSDNDSLKRKLDQNESEIKRLTARISRAQEGINRVKLVNVQTNENQRESFEAIRRQLNEAKANQKRLERQKSEILAAFRKQTKLIDLLRRQKMSDSELCLVKQGAEAKLYKATLFSTEPKLCIVKERFTKAYRHPQLDRLLTLHRMKAELRQLWQCSKLGIPVPAVYHVDSTKRQIWMSHAGPNSLTLHHWLHDLYERTIPQNPGLCRRYYDRMASQLGQLLSKLHSHHIVHGDLTTANIMVRQKLPEQMDESNGDSEPLDLVLIDFGLSTGVSCDSSMRLPEEKGVDLYVFERALCSVLDRPPADCIEDGSDILIPENMLERCLHYYEHFYQEMPRNNGLEKAGQKRQKVQAESRAPVKEILHRLSEIRMRGRKRVCIG